MKLKYFYLGLLLIFWLGSAMPALAAAAAEPRLLHTINRLSYGLRPGELEQMQTLGIDRPYF